MAVPPVDTAIIRGRRATKSTCSNLGYGPYGRKVSYTAEAGFHIHKKSPLSPRLRRAFSVARLQRVMETGGGGIRRPLTTSDNSLQNRHKSHTKQAQQLAKSDTCKNRKSGDFDKTHTCSEQENKTSLHKKCAICVHQNLEAGDSLPLELTELIRLWPELLRHIKMSIRALVELYKATEEK